MSELSKDVEYLRAQYTIGKKAIDAFIVEYNGSRFNDKDELKRESTQIIPKVQIKAEIDPQYPYFTLIMADPDAPRRGNERAGPWLHWIQASFQGDKINEGTTLADYQGPAPPAGTGPHQYIFLLYKTAKADVSSAGPSIPVSDSARRKQFALKKFEEDHQLELVATTSYIVIG